MGPVPAISGASAYTIGDLADQFGISRRTLRFYEERELLCPRRVGAHRIYSEDDRARLEIIIRAKRLGFSLAVIWERMERRSKTEASKMEAREPEAECCDALALSEDEICAQVERLTTERERIDRAIEELRAAAARDGVLSTRSAGSGTDTGIAG